MFRIMTLLASYFIGKSLRHSDGNGETARILFHLPLLMIRKILKLFMIGFGSLLVGVIGIAFLLRDLLFQLQIDSQIIFKVSTGISIFVVLAGFGVCAWIFQKKNWIQIEDLIVPVETVEIQEAQHQPDLMTVIVAMVSDLLSKKVSRRTSAP